VLASSCIRRVLGSGDERCLIEQSTDPFHPLFRLQVEPVLQALSTYADVLLEGRDLRRDAALLKASLTHALVHTVRARALVLRHNRRLKEKRLSAALQRVGVDYSDLSDGDELGPASRGTTGIITPGTIK